MNRIPCLTPRAGEGVAWTCGMPQASGTVGTYLCQRALQGEGEGADGFSSAWLNEVRYFCTKMTELMQPALSPSSLPPSGREAISRNFADFCAQNMFCNTLPRCRDVILKLCLPVMADFCSADHAACGRAGIGRMIYHLALIRLVITALEMEN